MTNLIFRTEDIKFEFLNSLFVETEKDRQIIDQLKSISPVVLVGSRGTGKSFLLRMAELEQTRDFAKDKVLSVYVSFNRSSLIHTKYPDQFQKWMLSRICSRVIRTLRKNGLLTSAPNGFSTISGSFEKDILVTPTKIEIVLEKFENSWKNPDIEFDLTPIPDIDTFKDAIEDLCSSLNIERLSIYIDEAAHVFIKEQQRQFFTLFRDLRFPFLTLNAAVYPGVTSYGDTFQESHDANFINLERDILDKNYIEYMKEIVNKQADSTLTTNIIRNGQNFAVLAYAASGNPRLLLKTINKANSLDSNSVNSVIREFYRTEIWSEHSGLYEKYTGYKEFIDWGRKFIESTVLPELQSKNTKYLNEEKNSTCFFWIHRDVSLAVKLALQILKYTGIITEHSTGIKATRSEIGIRYMINLGCLFALEATPSTTAFQIAKAITPKRMSEYGANHSIFRELTVPLDNIKDPDILKMISELVTRSVDSLDISDKLKINLKKGNFMTISQILEASEEKLQEVHYVGPTRATQIKESALAAVFEYISG